ncbi:MAG: hypothetical protein IJU60_02955 [Acholeplasmatales bacterium]|nr:hypothetical protein [Acholeplasmatales bacterium]
MKKFLTFLTLLFIILLFPITISAHDFDGEQNSQVEAIVGKSREELNTIDFINKLKKIGSSGYMDEGYLVYFRIVRNKTVAYDFDARIYFVDSKAARYEIYIDNVMMYRVTITDNGFALFNDIRIDYLSKYDDIFTTNAVGYNFVGTYNGEYNRQSLKQINSDIMAVGFNALNILSVEKLEDFEVKTYQDNLQNYKLGNLFSVSGVESQEIIDTDYNFENNTIGVGKYYIYSSGVLGDKLVYQKMIINVEKEATPTTPGTITTTTTTVEPTTTTTTAPVGTTTNTQQTTSNVTTTKELKIDDYVVGYRDNIEREKYIAYLKNKYGLDVLRIQSSYFDNANKIGKHNVEIITNDKVFNANIVVVDDVAPIIIGNNVTISSQTKFSLDEYRNRLTAVDEIDGTISCKNIKMEDLDGYLNNPNKSGVYKIEASVSDLSGNVCKSIFEIYVTDSNNYGVYIENATIIITNSTVASESDLINFLKKNGLITTNNVSLSSTYFDSVEPKGEYNLEVSENDNKNVFLIHVQDSKESEKEVKKDTDNKTNDYFIVYMIIGISSVIILIIIIVYVFIKKKH